MASRTIASPGVQITEQDLSIITRPIGSTDVLITGFTPQGPTEDVVNISDISEFEQIYGAPTNSAERYLYHSAKQILNTSPANLLVSRLPYGSDLGDGYSNKYSALIYPVSAVYQKTFEQKLGTIQSQEFVIGNTREDLLNLISILPVFGTSIAATTTAVIVENFNQGQYIKSSGAIENAIIGESLSLGTSYKIATITDSTLLDLEVSLGNIVWNDSYVGWDGNEADYTLYKSYSSSLVSDETYYKSVTSTDGVNYTVNLTAYEIIRNPVYNYRIDLTSYSPAGSTFVTETSSVQKLEDATTYVLQAPTTILLSDSEYQDIISGNITWNKFVSNSYTLSTYSDIGKSAMIVLNTAKRSINNLFEGYYVGIADNSNINPATDFDSIKKIYTNHSNNSSAITPSSYIEIPESRFNFKLSADSANFSSGASMSESLESYPTGYDFSVESYERFKDSLIMVLYKLRTSIYNQDTITLDYSIIEGYAGSLYSKRTQNNPTFGSPNSFFLDNVVEKTSNNIKVITNPYISKYGTWTENDGKPAKKVMVGESTKALFPSGVYTPENSNASKNLGNVPLKLQRVLNQIQNDDTINIDVVAECGLGTIWVGAKSKKEQESLDEYIFDETHPVDISELKNTSGDVVVGVNANYAQVSNKFLTFVSDRKDHVFIADPLRYIFVQGKDFKASARKNSYIFSTDIYWPLKNQFAGVQSSYACTYGNWLKTTDDISDQFVWVPSSGYAASIFASTSQQSFPWTAPAGLNRGTLINVFDVGIDANQKQADLLYKINVNPISFFGNDGYAIFGQKTLYRKPSAFDRINVRRLFLTLEKETKQLLKYYVFEANTFTTRQRLIGSLEPTFDKAKLNDGLYEYQIICDERNNTPDVIDNNELKISIYIKPVRTAEFILADFIGTRTGVSFSELIG